MNHLTYYQFSYKTPVAQKANLYEVLLAKYTHKYNIYTNNAITNKKTLKTKKTITTKQIQQI